MKAMTRQMVIIILLLTVLTILPSLMDKEIYAKEDKFGITEIYPTSPNGTEWFSSWNNGHTRELTYGQRDPYDGIELPGNGKLQINGEEGIATASGSAPRIRVVDLDFNNTEITFYGKRVSESEEVSYQGFVAGGRSKHYTDDTCYANTLYSRFTYDGRVSFEKELFHGEGEPAQYPPLDEAIYIWPAGAEGIPFDQWIGMKFVIRTLDDGEGPYVLLEVYRDLNDGEGGGEWEKVLQYKDIGDWYVDASEGVCDDYPHNKIILTPGFVFIRNDFVDDVQYKKFSIREIVDN
ncbi:MAG: hypothetical protein ACRD8W_08480 [Nitrososphaeraceae archaeon]